MTDIALVRTHHSLHEGAGKVKDYIGYAAANGIKSLIMADRASMADAISFYTNCKSHGINPIMGALLSVFDEEKVYSAQSSRNGSFFEKLYFYMTTLKGEMVDAEYVAKNFANIEKNLIAPLRKTALAKPKATSSQIKEAALFPTLALPLIGADSLIEQAEASAAQAGFKGAAAKKKLASDARKGYYGDIEASEDMFNNYLVAFSVATEMLENGASQMTKKDLIEEFQTNYSKYEHLVDSGNVLRENYLQWVSENESKKSFIASSFEYLQAKCKTAQGKQLTELVLKCAKGEELTTPVDNKNLGLEYYSHLIDGDNSEDIMANWHMLSLVTRSRGAFRPFGMSDIPSMTDHEFRELMTQVLYPVMLEAAANYKEKNEGCYSNITIFANTQEGYLNLKRLVSLSYMEGQSDELIEKKGDKRKVHSFPKLPVDRLRQFSEGLVAIVGLDNDELDKAVRYNKCADEAVAYYEGIFSKKNVLVGIQRSTTEEDPAYIQSVEADRNYKLVEIAKEHGLVAFALNNAYFLDKSDYEVMDNKAAVLLDEQVDSVDRIKQYAHGHYLKTPEQMAELFSDLPSLLNNTGKLNEHLGIGEHLEIAIDVPELPLYPIPEGMTDATYMVKLAEDGLWVKFEHNAKTKYKVDDLAELNDEQKAELEELRQVCIERLKYEAGIINNMGFAGYFLIVADFIVWAKANGVPVGHGRGSGAGSIIAYGLNITDIDPIRYNLLFERFLNPERVSMPDFDVDFGAGFHPDTGVPMDRDSVISYVQDKYNDPDALFPSVGQIATHGLVAAKSGIKKIAKARCLLPSFSDQLTKLFPDAPEVKIGDCFEIPEVAYRAEREREVSELMTLTANMEGLKQNSGVHAGGVVIARSEIVDYSPFHLDTRDMSKVIAQFDKSDVEHAGLVKFDFLGLANLTTMEIARKYIRTFREVDVNLNTIPYDDPKVFDLLRTGNSHGVFQVESEGMRKLLRKIQCDDMEDLSALLALYRPGPLQSGMVDNFIDRKHGREEISYPDSTYQHDCLKNILEPTYGIILYQEQVMQCAQAMAGYTLGGADLLRRAMGKKKPEEMAKQREIFAKGSVENGIDEELAMKIFDLIEKFAGYGFNKSHSMAYAHITYQTAYLKTHFPTEYMSALLTDQSDNPDKLKLSIIDCKKNGIEILPPDVNRSDTEFLPEGNSKIRYGLLAIKGVGEEKLKAILAEREANGEFKSILDLRERCGGSFDKKVAEGLLLAGALDSLGLEKGEELPEDALRLESEACPQSSTCPEVERLRAECVNKKTELDEIRTRGTELRDVITGLFYFYGERYQLPEMLEKTHGIGNAELKSSAEYLIRELPKLVSKGAEEWLVSEDVKNLNKRMGERDHLRTQYKDTQIALKKFSEEFEQAKDDFLSGAMVKDESGNRRVAFDKRAFLWEDINSFVVNLSIAQLIKGDKLEKEREKLTYKGIEPFSDAYRLKQEMTYLAYYVSGHPFDIDNMRLELAKSFDNTPIAHLTYPKLDNLEREERFEVIRNTEPSRVAGVIAEMRVIKIKKDGKNFGREMAILLVDDSMGEMSVMLMPDTYDLVKSAMFIGEPIALEGVVTYDDYKDDGSLTVTPDKILDPRNVQNAFYEKPQFNRKR